MNLFELGKNVIQVLEEHGHQAYFVGGFVRDVLLGRPIQDIDICTSAVPDEVITLFEHVIPTGIQHGTVTVMVEGVPIEVTTFRTEEGYLDHRRPSSVSFVTSLKEDLKRRDFSINAMAMDKDRNIYDYFLGREALENKVITTVGQAFERFSEDALRIMRAIRFSAQLGFTITEDVIHSMIHFKESLELVAIERTAAEWMKIMDSPYPNQAIHYLLQTKIYQEVYPFRCIARQLELVQEISLSGLEPIERWGLLLTAEEQDMEGAYSFLASLPLTKKMKNQVLLLLENLLRYPTITLLQDLSAFELYDLGVENTFHLIRINHLKSNGTLPNLSKQVVQEWLMKLPLKKETGLALKGHEMALYLQKEPGKWIGEAIESLIRAVLEGKVSNNQEELLQYLTNLVKLEDENE